MSKLSEPMTINYTDKYGEKHVIEIPGGFRTVEAMQIWLDKYLKENKIDLKTTIKYPI